MHTNIEFANKKELVIGISEREKEGGGRERESSYIYEFSLYQANAIYT